MTGTLVACSQSPAPDDKLDPVSSHPVPGLMSAQAAIESANIPTIDSGTLNDAQIAKVLQPGPRCDFQYTSSGKPSFAFSASHDGQAAQGVLKVNGHRVALKPLARIPGAEADGIVVMADPPMRVTLYPG